MKLFYDKKSKDPTYYAAGDEKLKVEPDNPEKPAEKCTANTDKVDREIVSYFCKLLLTERKRKCILSSCYKCSTN